MHSNSEAFGGRVLVVAFEGWNDAAEAAGRPEDWYSTVAFDHEPAGGDIGLEQPIRRFPLVPNRQGKLDPLLGL